MNVTGKTKHGGVELSEAKLRTVFINICEVVAPVSYCNVDTAMRALRVNVDLYIKSPDNFESVTNEYRDGDRNNLRCFVNSYFIRTIIDANSLVDTKQTAKATIPQFINFIKGLTRVDDRVKVDEQTKTITSFTWNGHTVLTDESCGVCVYSTEILVKTINHEETKKYIDTHLKQNYDLIEADLIKAEINDDTIKKFLARIYYNTLHAALRIRFFVKFNSEQSIRHIIQLLKINPSDKIATVDSSSGKNEKYIISGEYIEDNMGQGKVIEDKKITTDKMVINIVDTMIIWITAIQEKNKTFFAYKGFSAVAKPSATEASQSAPPSRSQKSENIYNSLKIRTDHTDKSDIVNFTPIVNYDFMLFQSLCLNSKDSYAKYMARSTKREHTSLLYDDANGDYKKYAMIILGMPNSVNLLLFITDAKDSSKYNRNTFFTPLIIRPISDGINTFNYKEMKFVDNIITDIIADIDKIYQRKQQIESDNPNDDSTSITSLFKASALPDPYYKFELKKFKLKMICLDDKLTKFVDLINSMILTTFTYFKNQNGNVFAAKRTAGTKFLNKYPDEILKHIKEFNIVFSEYLAWKNNNDDNLWRINMVNDALLNQHWDNLEKYGEIARFGINCISFALLYAVLFNPKYVKSHSDVVAVNPGPKLINGVPLIPGEIPPPPPLPPWSKSS